MLSICKFKTDESQDIEKLVKEFEEEQGISLPCDYRNFLIKYNGGYTPNTMIKQRNVSCFIGIGDVGRTFDSHKTTEWYDIFKERGYLAIADTPSGDYFIIGIEGEQRGKIFFKYHDRIGRNAKIADSFREFVEKCVSEKAKLPKPVNQSIKKFEDLGRTQEWIDAMIPFWEKQYVEMMHDRETQEQVSLEWEE